jgi:hypothetical protein
MDDRPFRLVVSVIRGTNAGRALQMMAGGIQCSAETEAAGRELFDRYLDAAAAVLGLVPVGICFGMVALLNTNTGAVVAT